MLKIRNDIPIIHCAGFSNMISQQKAYSLGINGFLMKPLTIFDLSKIIHNVMVQRQEMSQ